MLVQEATLAEYHEYSVEWEGSDLVFSLDGDDWHIKGHGKPM